MNNIFSEIFGCYYKAITEIVNNAPLCENEVVAIIKNFCFEESCFHLLPRIKELPFIEFKDGKYYSLLNNKIKMPITNLEKSWLKAIIKDPKFSLFNDDFDLENTNPLYEQEMFKIYDKYSDGDEFSNEVYKKNFRKINSAMDRKTAVKIIYRSPKRDTISIAHYLPIKFEFSPKDDKFRFFAVKISNGRIIDYVCLNMARIIEVRNSHEQTPQNIDLENHLQKFEAEEPVIVEIYNERNSIERFMIEFSAYKKQSEFDKKRDICTTKIFYRKTDETELLIKLLSFGPTLKVLGPDNFLEQFKNRIQRQMELIKHLNNNKSRL